jgi:hypothetical protein
VRAGLPVEINPSVGDGFRVMSWEEWAGRFKVRARLAPVLLMPWPLFLVRLAL